MQCGDDASRATSRAAGVGHPAALEGGHQPTVGRQAHQDPDVSTLVRGVGPDFLDAVRTRLGSHAASDGSLGVAVEAAARDVGAVLGSSALRSVTRTVRDELFGAGRLQVLLDDPDVTDVLVNGPRDVWVERAGRLGRADVDLTDLVRHALRMRPDRIVLGECRGAEVREVLAALNTGHDGGCATVHANTAADVPARLEALAALAGMSREAVAAQAASAFDAVLHLRRADRRYVSEVGVVRRAVSGELEVACAIRVEPSGATMPGPAWSALADRLGLSGARAELRPPP